MRALPQFNLTRHLVSPHLSWGSSLRDLWARGSSSVRTALQYWDQPCGSLSLVREVEEEGRVGWG